LLIPAAYLAAGAGAAVLAGEITPAAEADAAGVALVPMFLVAAGIASLAPLLGHSLAAPSGRQASHTMLWTAFVTMVLLAGAILLGEALAEAVGWEGPTQLLRDPIAATLSLAALPSVLSGLLSAGALAAVLAIGQSALFAAATTLSHEIWDEIVDPKGPTGRRIFLARIAAVGVAALAVWLAPVTPMEPPVLLVWGLAFAAAGSFVPILLGLWWPRCNGIGAALGSGAGLLVSGWGFLYELGAFPWAEPGVATGAGAASAAAIGVAAALLTAIGVSLITPAPNPELQNLAGELRRGGRGRLPLRERPA
jgi:Na+/proline symporter